MPRKKMGRTRKQKRKNSLDHDDGNISHSESTTNNNSQSESWECPVSARRNLIPNSKTTVYRRRTLRSSARLSETGTASRRRSSAKLSETGTASRRRSSKRHSSARDDIQQLDDTSNTRNSANQVSLGSDQVEIESPSRYLVSFAYPHSVEPELGHKEAENVENSTVVIPNMMEEEVGEAEPNNMMEEEVGEAEPNNMMEEEVGEAEPNNMMEEEVGEAEPNNMIEKEGEGEAEKSSSNHAGKNRFEKESIPLEPESLAGGITNKNQRKCISRVGCSSPLRSLQLTEMVEMVGIEDDDEEIQSRPEDTVKGYQVKEEFRPILTKIIGKYGDIAKNCLTESVECRSTLLEMICGIISEFEKKDLSKTKEGALKSKISLVEGIKKMNVEVEWLHLRLIEVLEARELLMQSGMLKEKTDQNKKLLKESESALEKCEARKKEVEEQLKAICDEEAVCKNNLARAKNDSATISREVGFAKSKVRRFLHCSVVDGLI